MVRGPHPQPEPSETELVLYQEGPVFSEINLLRYPFALLSNNNLDELLEEAARKKKSHISYKTKTADGQIREWRVKPNVESGYTRPFDKKVIVTVLKLATDEGFPPPLLWKLGSCKRICRIMKIPDTGHHPGRVKQSLIRISDSTIYTECFYLKREQNYWKEKPTLQGGNFTLWNVYWRGKKLPNGEIADSIYLQFNVPFILSLHDFYVKPLDYDYWLKLSPLAQRLYELTGLKFYGLKDSPYIVFEYPELCQAMPIRPQKHFSKARQILERAHQQLIKTQWFERVEWMGGKDQSTLLPGVPWSIRYYPGSRARLELAQARERLRRFQQKVLREELPPWIDVQTWVREMMEMLSDPVGKNKGFYTKIAKLIVQGELDKNLVWEALHTAKVEGLEGRVEKTRSAFFTDYLKRQLQKQGQDLNQLLQEA